MIRRRTLALLATLATAGVPMSSTSWAYTVLVEVWVASRRVCEPRLEPS